jgi:hypothetical protein
MSYLAIYDSTGDLIDAGNPLSVGPLSIDTEEVSAFVKMTVKTVQDGAPAALVTAADTTISVVDATGADSSDLWQLAPDNAGAAGTPVAYGADLVITAVVNATTGVVFWARRKAGAAETPSTDTTAVIHAACPSVVAA